MTQSRPKLVIARRVRNQALVECEEIIKEGLKTFLDVGKALARIRDEKLYKEDYTTFDDYCHKRWGWSSSRSRQLIDGAKLAQHLGSVTKVTPSSERVVRPLLGMPVKKAEKVWAEVIRKEDPDVRATAHMVEVEVVRQGLGPASDPPMEPLSLINPDEIGKVTLAFIENLIENFVHSSKQKGRKLQGLVNLLRRLANEIEKGGEA